MDVPSAFHSPPPTVPGTASTLAGFGGEPASTIHAALAGPRSEASLGGSVMARSLSATGDHAAPCPSGGRSTTLSDPSMVPSGFRLARYRRVRCLSWLTQDASILASFCF